MLQNETFWDVFKYCEQIELCIRISFSCFAFFLFDHCTRLIRHLWSLHFFVLLPSKRRKERKLSSCYKFCDRASSGRKPARQNILLFQRVWKFHKNVSFYIISSVNIFTIFGAKIQTLEEVHTARALMKMLSSEVGVNTDWALIWGEALIRILGYNGALIRQFLWHESIIETFLDGFNTLCV